MQAWPDHMAGFMCEGVAQQTAVVYGCLRRSSVHEGNSFGQTAGRATYSPCTAAYKAEQGHANFTAAKSATDPVLLLLKSVHIAHGYITGTPVNCFLYVLQLPSVIQQYEQNQLLLSFVLCLKDLCFGTISMFTDLCGTLGSLKVPGLQ